MQIKRFEAQDMTTALDRVKKEFGPDAVILSARSIQPENGLMKVLRKTGVEVTAAIDSGKAAMLQAPPERLAATGSAGHNGAWRSGGMAAYAREAGRLQQQPQTKQTKGVVMVHRKATADASSGNGARLRRRLQAQGVRDTIISDLMQKLSAGDAAHSGDGASTMGPRLARLLESKGVTAPLDQDRSTGRRVIALVGPAGVGKTTAAVRLAAQYRREDGDVVGLISLDSRKIAAREELQTFGRIIGVPVAVAWDPSALRGALRQMADRQVIIIDTPGIPSGDDRLMNAVGDLLDQAGAQTVLLLSAATKAADQEKVLDRFSALAIQRLLLTRLDETDTYGSLINLPLARRIPIAWLAHGTEIPEALSVATGQAICNRLLPSGRERQPTPPGANGLQQERAPLADQAIPAAAVRPAATETAGTARAGQYVANRNSDIFHVPQCKWTKLIKSDNMIVFDSIAAAKAQKYNACRYCCPNETAEAAAVLAARRNRGPAGLFSR